MPPRPPFEGCRNADDGKVGLLRRRPRLGERLFEQAQPSVEHALLVAIATDVALPVGGKGAVPADRRGPDRRVAEAQGGDQAAGVRQREATRGSAATAMPSSGVGGVLDDHAPLQEAIGDAGHRRLRQAGRGTQLGPAENGSAPQRGEDKSLVAGGAARWGGDSTRHASSIPI